MSITDLDRVFVVPAHAGFRPISAGVPSTPHLRLGTWKPRGMAGGREPADARSERGGERQVVVASDGGAALDRALGFGQRQFTPTPASFQASFRTGAGDGCRMAPFSSSVTFASG